VGNKFFGLFVGRVFIGVGEDNSELIATQSAHNVGVPEISRQYVSHMHQRVITSQMPICIVDFFEVVDVEIEHAGGFPIPFSKRHGTV